MQYTFCWSARTTCALRMQADKADVPLAYIASLTRMSTKCTRNLAIEWDDVHHVCISKYREKKLLVILLKGEKTAFEWKQSLTDKNIKINKVISVRFNNRIIADECCFALTLVFIAIRFVFRTHMLTNKTSKTTENRQGIDSLAQK